MNLFFGKCVGACLWGILFWIPWNVHALYLGNPDGAELVTEGLWSCSSPWIGGEAGYQIDNVFNRRVKIENAPYLHISPYKMRFNQGVVTLIGFNRAEIYAPIGAIEMDFTTQNRSTGALTQFQTNDHFTWGIGGRLILSEWWGIVFGVLGSFQHARFCFSPTEWMGRAASPSAGLRYYEWQLGGGMSTTMDWFTPYIAAKYSYFSANVTTMSSKLKLRSVEHFGLVLGFSLAAKRAFSLTVEARLIDEESLTGAWSFRF